MPFEFTDFSSISVLVLTVTNKKYWGLRKDINEDLKIWKIENQEFRKNENTKWKVNVILMNIYRGYVSNKVKIVKL